MTNGNSLVLPGTFKSMLHPNTTGDITITISGVSTLNSLLQYTPDNNLTSPSTNSSCNKFQGSSKSDQFSARVQLTYRSQSNPLPVIDSPSPSCSSGATNATSLNNNTSMMRRSVINCTGKLSISNLQKSAPSDSSTATVCNNNGNSQLLNGGNGGIGCAVDDSNNNAIKQYEMIFVQADFEPGQPFFAVNFSKTLVQNISPSSAQMSSSLSLSPASSNNTNKANVNNNSKNDDDIQHDRGLMLSGHYSNLRSYDIGTVRIHLPPGSIVGDLAPGSYATPIVASSNSSSAVSNTCVANSIPTNSHSLQQSNNVDILPSVLLKHAAEVDSSSALFSSNQNHHQSTLQHSSKLFMVNAPPGFSPQSTSSSGSHSPSVTGTDSPMMPRTPPRMASVSVGSADQHYRQQFQHLHNGHNNHHQQFNMQNHHPGLTPPSASSSNSGSNAVGVNRPVRYCYGCGDTGHLHKDCPRDQLFCYNCNETGHSSKNCKKPKPWEQNGGAGAELSSSFDTSGNGTEVSPTSSPTRKMSSAAISNPSAGTFTPQSTWNLKPIHDTLPNLMMSGPQSPYQLPFINGRHPHSPHRSTNEVPLSPSSSQFAHSQHHNQQHQQQEMFGAVGSPLLDTIDGRRRGYTTSYVGFNPTMRPKRPSFSFANTNVASSSKEDYSEMGFFKSLADIDESDVQAGGNWILSPSPPSNTKNVHHPHNPHNPHHPKNNIQQQQQQQPHHHHQQQNLQHNHH